MEIAFSSERSIQDAIAELSQAETSTVLISYSVMFIYVSFALGKFRSYKTILVWKLLLNYDVNCTIESNGNFYIFRFIQSLHSVLVVYW